VSAASNQRALLQHEAIKAYALQRGVTPEMVIDAMENGNAVVRNEVDAMVAVEVARQFRSVGLVGVHHEEESASDPVGMSGQAIAWLIGACVVAAVVGLVVAS
jgi:hypothetical protein